MSENKESKGKRVQHKGWGLLQRDFEAVLARRKAQKVLNKDEIVP